jgi:hypothetical protein
MKIKTALSNPQVDFFVKSYLLVLIIPFIGMSVWLRLFYLLFKSWWESPWEGAFAYALWGTITGYYAYFLFLFLTVLLVLFFNKKLMSGKLINKRTKFGLFLLSILFYIFTLLAFGYIQQLF